MARWSVATLVGALVGSMASLGRSAVAAIPEPFPYIHGYNATAGPSVPQSPDPLVQYRWSPIVNRSQLQVYVSYPIRWDAFPPSSFHIDKPKNGKMSVKVLGAGSLKLDFGTERAAWLEFDSGDLTPGLLQHLTCGLSEYDSPLEGKTRRPVGFGNTFRLETNDELYEGLRYAWINNSPPNGTATVFHLDNLRVVAKVKPVNYTGAYTASDSTLTSIWYTGAYAVRLNMLSDNFGSILVERGDRVAIQGDGHPTMAAALAAFGPESYGLIQSALIKTDSGCPGCHVVDDSIMAYPIYWTMSVNDYYWASGDSEMYEKFVPDIQSILDKAASTFYPLEPSLVWMGWDDRLGDGWCGSTCPHEAQLTFMTLLVRAHKDFSVLLEAAGYSDLAVNYADTATRLGKILTNSKEWLNSYGFHSAANAINAGLPMPAETTMIFERELNDVVKLCSLSPFNQYWILQALGNADKMDHALASIKLCWGGMTTLGRGCFWELYDPQWASIMKPGEKVPTKPSYCHPWSSGVTAWMTREHAGLKPLEPGYKSFLAAPFVSRLNPSVSGTVTTPYGELQINATLDNANNEVTVTVQAAVKGRIALRRVLANNCILVGFRRLHDTSDSQSLSMNILPPLSAEAVSEGISLPLGPQTASLGFSPGLPPGRHVVVGIYSGCGTTSIATSDNPFAPYPPASYPATTSTDAATRGDWVGKYGSQGYLLFGFNNGTDVSKLPRYVSGVTGYYFWAAIRHNLTSVFYGTSSSNSTYLEPPPSSSTAQRALGSIEADPTERGIALDIGIDKNFTDRYRVSLYMVANNKANDMAIRAMDLPTLSPIAQMPLIQNFDGGVYWSMEYGGSGVRLRVMPRYGAATVSAIFFDPVI